MILQFAWGAAGAERWAAGLRCSRWENLPAWQHVAHIPRIPQASTSCTALWGLPFYSSVTFSLVCDYDIIHKDQFNPSWPLMLSFECVLLCPSFFQFIFSREVIEGDILKKKKQLSGIHKYKYHQSSDRDGNGPSPQQQETLTFCTESVILWLFPLLEHIL